jgi:hypothetical protein
MEWVTSKQFEFQQNQKKLTDINPTTAPLWLASATFTKTVMFIYCIVW